MTSRRILLSVVAATLCFAGTGSALAATDSSDTKRVCVALSGDSEKQPTAPICVWVPLGE